MPYLMRAHAFKMPKPKNKEISVGTFNYPMLMAADILLYDTDLVPVAGSKAARRVTREPLKIQPDIRRDVQITQGLILRTSKRFRHWTARNEQELPQHDPVVWPSRKRSRRQCGIVHRFGRRIPKNVHAIHSLFRPKAELEKLYGENQEI